LGSSSKATFLRAYFATAPGGSDAAWRRLGPGEQRQGRAAYDRFWKGISSVAVSDVRPVTAGGTQAVDATVTYRLTSGSTSRERKRFLLVAAPSGGWLINGERAAS
jgi:hypothetical protein